ncbi:MAG: hypothetical protein IT161_11870 [Bryobacterales bacterium]|nr:hypothetical protein [Bryobacterales bacterium]
MNRRAILLLASIAMAAAPAFADFSYEQTSKITGGMVANMMRMAGPFAAKAREPQTSTIMVKGNRMATVNKNSMNVVDLDARTITEVDFEKKTYSVLTFDQMKQIYQEMQKRLQSPDFEVNAQIKVDIKETGAHKQIAGHDAREVVTRVDMEAKDPKTGQTMTTEVISNTWLASEIAGYKEVREFYRRMAEALGWMPGQIQGGQPGMAKGMIQVTREVSKLEGLPVLQITKMTGPGGMQEAGASSEQTQNQPAPSGDDVAQAAAKGAERQAESEALSQVYRTGGATGRVAAGALGGMMGGFRRKKPAEPPPAAPAQPAAQQTPPPAQSGSSLLLEMTTEMSNHSAASIDPSRMSVPAGYKEVESHLLKTMGPRK